MVLSLLQFEETILGQLEFPLLFSKLLLLKLDLNDLIFDHLSLFLRKFDFFTLELIFSLPERALHDLCDIYCAFLHTLKNLSQFILLTDL